MTGDRIVAIGLLTERDLGLLGASFDRLWPIEEAPHFQELLRAIDNADRQAEQADHGQTEQARC